LKDYKLISPKVKPSMLLKSSRITLYNPEKKNKDIIGISLYPKKSSMNNSIGQISDIKGIYSKNFVKQNKNVLEFKPKYKKQI